jgi:NADP-dependent 3-hydroxy acid dehydrogenase YdfG
MRMAGQVAVVTGAGRGIGRAIGRRLAAEGAALVLAARSTAEIAAAAAEIGGAGGRAEAVATDVRDEASVAALVHAALERHGRIDVLVAAAGVAAFAEASAITLADWDQMMTVNLRGAFLSIRAVLPAMMARRRGTIIAVGSMVTGRTLPGSGAYTASKYGLLGFCRVLAEEMRAHGVRVGVLSAGAVDTPLWDATPNGPDRAHMIRAEQVAEAAVLMATLDTNAALEELTLMPARGVL